MQITTPRFGISLDAAFSFPSSLSVPGADSFRPAGPGG